MYVNNFNFVYLGAQIWRSEDPSWEKERENSRKQVEKSASKEGHSDKVACLLFTATVQTDRGTIKLTAQSNPIQLSKCGYSKWLTNCL